MTSKNHRLGFRGLVRRAADRLRAARRDFRSDIRGGFMVMFSMLLPVMMGAAWVGVNMSYIASQRSELQAAADAAAIAAAKQMTLSGQTAATIQQVATNMAFANMPPSPYASVNGVSTSINTGTATVTVGIQRTLAPILGTELGLFSNVINVTSTAQYRSSPICAVILDPTGAAALSVSSKASIAGSGCSLISDSTSLTGVSNTSSGMVTAAKTCSAGGYSGSNFSPLPIQDCPVLADPLASRTPPSNVNNACDHVNYTVIFALQTLQPGIYCGGITIAAGIVKFAPGDYIIRGGSLNVAIAAGISGTDVGFYLTGGATINAQALTALNLTAPSNPADPMVGLVFWEDPKNSSGAPLTHVISSDFGQNLEGTAYFPQGKLSIGGNAKVGHTSNYTIIVARDLVVDQSAQLVLNTNYMGSAVPVPPGVGNTGGQISLSQ